VPTCQDYRIISITYALQYWDKIVLWDSWNYASSLCSKEPVVCLMLKLHEIRLSYLAVFLYQSPIIRKSYGRNCRANLLNLRSINVLWKFVGELKLKQSRAYY